MNVRCAVICAGLAALLFTEAGAQGPKPVKNLLENGDFTAGMARWNGDGKAEALKEGEPASAPKTASGLDALKPLTPPGNPLPALPATPRPPFGAAEKPGAGQDRSCVITLGTKSQFLSQRFTVPRTARVLKIQFRARPAEGFRTARETLGALQVRVQIPSGQFVYFDRHLAPTTEWQDYTLSYTVPENSRNLEFKLEVHAGSGRIYLDDFVIEALDQ